jgi:hypothetical protein
VAAVDAFAWAGRLPFLMGSTGRLLNKYGDGFLFGGVATTPPIACNPRAATGMHTAVPHRYLYAYLVAIKSFLQYHADVAVYAHDDGSLLEADKDLIRRHVPEARVIDRAWADREFAERVGDEFLVKVRKSYTSYLKLFDPTLVSTNQRILIVDTDVLFLHRPEAVIEWAQRGGPEWYHRSGPWSRESLSGGKSELRVSSEKLIQPTHIQQLVVQSLSEINETLQRAFAFVQGFNSGLIGYERGTVQYGELKRLLTHLYERFGDRIFRWGSEQTVHGLILCGRGAIALPMDRYMVYTDLSCGAAPHASFVHFIGEFRFNGFLYPRLAAKVIRDLRQ